MSKQIHVGAVAVGGGAPVSIQSMCNTPTQDVERTVSQILRLEGAGCQIIRVAVPDEDAAKAVDKIKEQIAIPLIADIHFNYKLALMCAERGIDALRINPGNIGGEEKVKAVADICRQKNIPIRIGVNGGSLEKELRAKYGGVTAEALVESAMGHVRLLNRFDFDDICISVKCSDVPLTMRAYTLLSQQTDYPLHLGVTEAGTPSMGMVKSAMGIGGLLCMGIGDTIRVSLTPAPGASRTEEVIVAQEILQSMELRSFTPLVTSCPGCGRTSSDLFQRLAQETQQFLRARAPEWRRIAPGSEAMKVAVMGCIVNGPGESRQADIGVSLPGSGESPVAPVYIRGEKAGVLKGADIAKQFQDIIEKFVRENYAKQGS